MPHSPKLFSCCGMFKHKYRDGAYERHRARLIAMGYQQEIGRNYFESFSPTCSHSTVRLVLALTSVPRWRSLHLDAVCAFISSNLAEGKHVYMKGPLGYDIGDGKYLSMLKCIYGLMQASRQLYSSFFCRKVYQKAGMKQLLTDECVFTRYISNITWQPSLTNEDLLVNGKYLNTEIVPLQMRVYRSCCHPVAAMILVMLIITVITV